MRCVPSVSPFYALCTLSMHCVPCVSLSMHCVPNVAFRHRPSRPRQWRRQKQVPLPSSPQLPPQLQPQQITSKEDQLPPQELQSQPKQECIPQAQPCQICQQITCQVSCLSYNTTADLYMQSAHVNCVRCMSDQAGLTAFFLNSDDDS